MKNLEEHKMNGRILAVYADDDLYVGCSNRFINFTKGRVLCTHEKSVRSVSGNGRYVGCSSYDGAGTVFSRAENRLVERIEGPDTEVKGIAFDKNFVAVATRGKAVWILEDMEISKILDDHTQDVKGVCFYAGRLYSWSYDNTVKMYELFDVEHSWELMQSVDLGDIVWSVVFFDGNMCATLQSGHVVVLGMENGQWTEHRRLCASAYPIVCACVAGECLAVVCNRNCLLLLDRSFKLVSETMLGEDDQFDIFCCCFWEKERAVVCGGENGILYIVKNTANAC